MRTFLLFNLMSFEKKQEHKRSKNSSKMFILIHNFLYKNQFIIKINVITKKLFTMKELHLSPNTKGWDLRLFYRWKSLHIYFTICTKLHSKTLNICSLRLVNLQIHSDRNHSSQGGTSAPV